MRSGVISSAFSSSIFWSQLGALGRLALVELGLAALERLVDLREERVHQLLLRHLLERLAVAKIRPSFFAPVMPKSAADASPMPLTAQPSTATSIGSS